jgi:hypothetical protein
LYSLTFERTGSSRENEYSKKPRQPPFPHQLEALLLGAAVAHMIIRLLDLSTPPPFFFHGVVEFFYYEDFLLVNDDICKYSGGRLPTTGLISSEYLTPLATSECLSKILQTIHTRDCRNQPLLLQLGREGGGAAWASLYIYVLWALLKKSTFQPQANVEEFGLWFAPPTPLLKCRQEYSNCLLNRACGEGNDLRLRPHGIHYLRINHIFKIFIRFFHF